MNESLPKLLRAIASGTQAKENKHDIILNAAADEIEQLRAGRVNTTISAPTSANRQAEARAAIIIVIGGNKGMGFSCQADDPTLAASLPAMLEELARRMREDWEGKIETQHVND